MTLDRLTTTQLERLRIRTQQREDSCHAAIFRGVGVSGDGRVQRYWLRCDVADRVAAIYRQRLLDDMS